MDGGTERRILYLLCLLVLVLGLFVLSRSLDPLDTKLAGVSLGLVALSVVTAIAANLAAILEGREPAAEATWNAVCLADFGDGGVAFVAQPQLPPRNVNWSASGKWVHLAKIGFEKYFLRKLRKGTSEPFYESLALKVMGIDKLKEVKKG